MNERRINEILWAIARGTSVASLMRKHGFTRAELRAWENKYGMPYIYKEPSPKKLAALRAWRGAPTRARAWARFVRAAQAVDGEVPNNPDRYENHQIHAWSRSRVLLVYEKPMMRDALEHWDDRRRPSFAFTHRAALAHTSWLPSREGVDAVMTHAREIPAAFICDLDPQALHWYATLRAGGADELLRSNRKRHRIVHVGLNSRWLDWLEERSPRFLRFTIEMRHADREYWDLVQRLVPDVRELIGARASTFLDGGKKIEVDGLIIQHRKAFLHELGRRVRNVIRTNRSKL